jgi:hypothetical protein
VEGPDGAMSNSADQLLQKIEPIREEGPEKRRIISKQQRDSLRRNAYQRELEPPFVAYSDAVVNSTLRRRRKE